MKEGTSSARRRVRSVRVDPGGASPGRSTERPETDVVDDGPPQAVDLRALVDGHDFPQSAAANGSAADGRGVVGAVAGEPVRILILEDSPRDAELMVRELRRAGIAVTVGVGETREDLARELAQALPDIILSDYAMPAFTGLEALALVKASHPSLPVIIVTGSLDEETAVECIKAGAADYVLKAHLFKLAPAVQRVLREQQVAAERDRAERALSFTQLAVDSSAEAAFWVDSEGRLVSVNLGACTMLGFTRDELLAMRAWDIDPATSSAAWSAMFDGLRQKKAIIVETALLSRCGAAIPVEMSIAAQEFEGQEYAIAFARDISERRAADLRIRRLNRLLRTSSLVNQLIVHEQERSVLLAEACRIMVEAGQLLAAWIGFPTADGGEVSVAAAFGVDAAVLTPTVLDCAGPQRADAPCCVALRENRVVRVDDLAAASSPGAWQALARERGASTAVFLPLRVDGRALGVLAAWSADATLLDEDSVVMMGNVADDIAFALRGLAERDARRWAEDKLSVNASILERTTAARDLPAVVCAVIETVQNYLQIEAIGVRLQEGDDFPYYQTSGFPAAFVEVERSLCARDASGSVVRDAHGLTVLECMCGNVVCGRTDPAQQFFTVRGSFWTNSSTDLLASTTEGDVLRTTRNRCNREGYESVALIPLRSAGSTIGLLQLNDRRRDRFSSQLIQWVEEVADTIGIAVAKAQAEAALEHSEERHRELFERIGEGVGITDADERFVLANPAAHAIFGVAAGELVGRRVTDFLDDAGRAMIAEQTAQRRLGTTTEYGLTIRRPDGKERQILITASPQPCSPGEVPLTFGVFRDVTELRTTQAQLLQSQKMDAIGRLAGGVAHDFNNQLQVVLMYCDLARAELRADDPLVTHLSQIRTAAERSASLTGQLLAFSRKQTLEPTVLDLNRTVGTMDAMLRRLVGEDVEVATVLAPELGLVKADAGQLEHVFVNLVVNAREAMAKGGRLTIETANVELDDSYVSNHPDLSPGSYVMVAVSDTGCGMDEVTTAKIFEPFFTTKENGTGLGLAMAHGIVHQSGGHVECSSRPGQGTRFTIFLPRHEDRLVAERPPARPPSTARPTGTLLVAEDEAALRISITKVLEKEGYTVLAAANGGEALLLARRHPGRIDLLITDMVMPGMSGQQLADEVVGARPGLKVLLVSGYTGDAVTSHGDLGEGVAFLQKPFGRETLTAKIRELLDDTELAAPVSDEE